MADATMRLRVVVLRNGLPETRYMLPVPLDGNPTIAKLLELVNGCTPIESDDWGLDDYVVELPAPDGSRNECLHFHPIRAVLKEDDQVFIRPLQTDDLRRRRISGRYQISSDGKHLVDGVAFGRPLLRALASRPAIYIPPRKRRRLLQSDDEGEDEVQDDAENPQMLLLTNGEDMVDEGDNVEAGAQAEADFSPSSSNSDSDEGDDEMDEDEDLDDELEALRKENAEIDIDMDDSQAVQKQPESRRGRAEQPPMTLEALDKLGALRAAFPAAPLDLCEKVLAANHDDLKLAYTNLKEAFNPALPESAVLSGNLFGTQSSAALEPQAAASVEGKKKETKSVDGQENGNEDMDDDENSGSGSDEDVPDYVKRYDRCGLPPGTISSGQGLASMAAITGSSDLAHGQATSTTMRPTKIIFRDEEDPADTTSSSESSSSSESEDSSDDEASSDSDSEGDQGGKDQNRSLSGREELESDSDSDDSSFQGGSDGDSGDDSSSVASGDSGSDNDSGPEETTTRQVQSAVQPKTVTQDSSSESSSSDSSDSDSVSSSDESSSDEEATPAARPKSNVAPVQAQQAQQTVPPGQGKACTKSRNARRRLAKNTQRAQQSGASEDVDMAVTSGDPTLQTANEKAAFEAKRQALLDALASGGIELDPSGSADLRQAHKADKTSKRKRDDEHAEGELNQAGGASEKAHGDSSKLATMDVTAPDSQQKRQRFNLEVGKRLLFGALGLRAPKTADDAERVKAKLMKDVRPLINARLEAEKQTNEAEASKPLSTEDQMDTDAWREKINYRAVECCQEGIALSEPPFPFVQRWDPQQQGLWNGKKNKRGGRAKKADRNQSHFYEEDNRGGKKRKQDDSQLDGSFYDDTTFNRVADLPDDDAVLDYDDPVAEEPSNEAQGEVSQFTDIDDLPSLPTDLKSLPVLQAQNAKVGMVITWKKLTCSAATQWQPLVSDVTAIVIRAENEGSALEVCLAKRDRHLDRVAKQYDEVTGERLYGKFEAPDIYDDDNDDELDQEQEEDGYRALDFTELLEPRIVQQPTTDELSDQPEAAHTNGNAHSDPAISLIPSIEQSSGRASSPGGLRASFVAVDDKDEREDADVNRVVSAQSGKSPMPLSENSSSNPTGEQAGQGHQGSIISGQDLLREPSPIQSCVVQQTSKELEINERFLEEPSGYEGDLDTLMADNEDAVVHETQAEVDSSAHTPTPFHDAKSNASALESEDELDDVVMFGDDDVIAGTPTAPRSVLKAASPMSSVASGRQPDPITNNNILELDTYKVPSTSGGTARDPAAVFGSTSPGAIDAGDDPFASDEVISSKSVGLRGTKGADYEAAIRELDGSLEPSSADDEPSPVTSRTRIIKTEHGVPQPRDESSEDELPPVLKVATLIRSTSINAPISPPAIKSGRHSTGATPASVAKIGAPRCGQEVSAFSLPSGSQVISLLSSSDAEDEGSTIMGRRQQYGSGDEQEPVFMENYADSDRDASYDPDNPVDVDNSLSHHGPGSSARKLSAADSRSRVSKKKKRASVTRSSPSTSAKRSTRLSASQQTDNDDRRSVVVPEDDSQQSRPTPPPASAPVQSAFSAFKKGRKLGGSGSQGSSGTTSSSSTAKRSWSGTAGASRF
ncbi:transcriptional regulator ATRX [Microdochium nivale]|nr:transcriptional regulator ATRX [Microdochium nivale]